MLKNTVVAGSQEGFQRALLVAGLRTGLLTNVAGVNLYMIDVDGHRRLMMEVGDESSDIGLRRAIPAALKLRDRLLKAQGPYTRSGANQYLETLLKWKQAGKSYAELAKIVNSRVVEYLTAYAEYENNPDSDDWYSRKDSKADPFGLEEARFMLAALRMNSAEIDGLLAEALKRLRKRQPAFEPGYPLSREKVISALRYWRTKRKRT